MARVLVEPQWRDRRDRRVKVPRRQEDTQSGDVSVPLLSIGAGTRVSSATASVSGAAFYGRVRDLAGARVTQSQVVYNADGVAQSATGEESAFIVDFAATCSVLSIAMTDGSYITRLVPWLGTDFAPQMSWFVSSGNRAVDLTGPETQKLFVQLTGGDGLTDETFAAACRIGTGTLPSNVRASVGGRPPFWTSPGMLSDEVEITGLEAELNALAESAPGEVTLDITTDTPGVLTVSLGDVVASETAAASWAGKPSTSVALKALEPTVVAVPFPTMATGFVQSVELEVSGSFPRWRAYTVGTEDTPGRLSMKIDARFAVARCLPIDAPTSIYGVSLLSTGSGELHVELVDTLTSTATKPLAMADVAVDTASPVWLDVMFTSAVDVPAGELWLVAKAKTGTAEWTGTTVSDTDAGPATLSRYSTEGSRWEDYPALGPVAPTTQIRVLRLPDPTDATPLLALSWPDGDGEPVEVNVSDTPTAVTLTRNAPIDAATVEVAATAASTGTLTLKSATAYT